MSYSISSTVPSPASSIGGPRDTQSLQNLAASSDLQFLPPIEYAFDPLPTIGLCISNSPCPAQRPTWQRNRFLASNAIRLDPLAAGLPYRSSIDHIYVNRYWASIRTGTIDLLQLLASDDSKSDIEVEQGITLARLAQKTLRSGKENEMALATPYMFPGADDSRISLINALLVLYFMFDDKAEETPNHNLKLFRDDFIHRVEGNPMGKTSNSALQVYVDNIVQCIEAEDMVCGNGGREMLNALRDAFQCVHPDERGFQSVEDYLSFRRRNVGAAFVIAAAKFSIKSDVSSEDPRFSRFLSLVGDHLGLVNDLASYDKELRALENGETRDMINIVDVTKKVFQVQGKDEAKSVVWALQLQMEQQLADELKFLRTQELANEEWEFLEAVTCTAVGNVLFCMTTGRYGGEAARIGGVSQPTKTRSSAT